MSIIQHRKSIVYIVIVFIVTPLNILSLRITLRDGWPQDIGSNVFSSPLASDLDGDGDNEILAVSFKNELFIYSVNSNLFLRHQDDEHSSSNKMEPVAFDLDGDGVEELLVRLSSGDILIEKNIRTTNKILLDSPLKPEVPNIFIPFVSYDKSLKAVMTASDKSIKVVDLEDGDFNDINLGFVPNSLSVIVDTKKRMNIVFATSSEGDLTGIDLEAGLKTFDAGIGPIENSRIALTDFESDGIYEIYTGSIDGRVYGIDSNGLNLSGFPVTLGSGFLDNGIYSSPALSDLNGDGEVEIVVNTGITQSENGSVFIISDEGKILARYDNPGSPIISSPVVCNLDDDEDLEVCSITYEGEFIGLNYDGKLVEGTPVSITGNLFSATPLVDDIDGDNFNELITLSEDGLLAVYDMNVKHINSDWNMFGANPTKNRFLPPVKKVKKIELSLREIEGRVEVVWDSQDEVDNWIVEYKEKDSEYYSELDTLPSGVLSCDVTQLKTMESVYVKVAGIIDGKKQLKSEDIFIEFTGGSEEEFITEIKKNYPNPFSNSTTIVFNVGGYSGGTRRVELSIIDITGKKVAQILSDDISSGEHSVVWDGTMDNGDLLSSGVYFCRMICGDEVKSKRLILLRE